MTRLTWQGAVLLSLAAGVASSLGCQVIVGSGDYAVGPAAGDDSGGSGFDASGSSSGDDGTIADVVSVDGGGKVGDPCATSADCPKGSSCQGLWCTQPCVSSASCGSNSAKQPNLCVANASGVGKSCAPSCQISSDCDRYTGSTCMQSGSTGYCVAPPTSEAGGGSGQIGDPCVTSTDCNAPATCSNATWCSISCNTAAANPDAACGSNSNGVPNHCVGDSSGNDICFPGCMNNGSCLGFSGTVCETYNGVQICAGTQGAIGDPCSTSTTTWTACSTEAGALTCNDAWCVLQDCSTDTECGSTTAGTPNYCVPSGTTNPVDGGAVNICFPGCKQYADCSVYSGTFCQPIVDSSRGFVCASSAGGIGDPCASSADCTTGTCENSWCTQSCSGPSDTSCGSNLQSVSNQCVFDSFAGSYQCSPGCTLPTDCTPYAGTSCTTVSGQRVCN